MDGFGSNIFSKGDNEQQVMFVMTDELLTVYSHRRIKAEVLYNMENVHNRMITRSSNMEKDYVELNHLSYQFPEQTIAIATGSEHNHQIFAEAPMPPSSCVHSKHKTIAVRGEIARSPEVFHWRAERIWCHRKCDKQSGTTKNLFSIST